MDQPAQRQHAVGAQGQRAVGQSWSDPVSGNWADAADWSNDQVPTAATNATISTAGDYTVSITAAESANALTIDDGGATVVDSGDLTLDTSLIVQAGTFSLQFGTLTGATVSTGPDGVFATQGGVFSDVTYEGTLNIDSYNAVLTIENGFTLAGAGGIGAGTIDIGGDYTQVEFADDTTLPAGVINFDGGDECELDAQARLTIGQRCVVISSAGEANNLAGATLINDGTIVSTSGASELSITTKNFDNLGKLEVLDSGYLAMGNVGSFTNTGTIRVDGPSSIAQIGADGTWTSDGAIEALGGSSIYLIGTYDDATLETVSYMNSTVLINGDLQNSGTYVVRDQSGLVLAGTVQGGAIDDAYGRLAVSGGTLAGVTYEGLLDLGMDRAALTIQNGFTLTGANGIGMGTLALSGEQITLTIADNETLSSGILQLDGYDDAITIDQTLTLGTKVQISALGGASNGLGGYGTLIDSGSVLCGDGALFLGPSDFVNQGVITALAGGDITVGATSFTNAGMLAISSGGTATITSAEFINAGTVDVTAGTLAISVAGGFVDTGAIIVSGGADATIQTPTYSATLDGSYQVSGQSGVQFGDPASADADAITTLAGAVALSGAGSFIDAYDGDHAIAIDSSLTTIQTGGTLSLASGRDWSATHAFTDNGLLQLSGVTFAEASIAVGVGGVLSGNGSVGGGVVNQGVIMAAGGTLSFAASLSGAGASNIGASACLSVGVVGPAQTVNFLSSSSGLLDLSAPSSFAALIAGFAGADQIDLLGTAATSLDYHDGTLDVMNGTTEVAALRFSGGYTSSEFSLGADGHGGALITLSHQ